MSARDSFVNNSLIGDLDTGIRYQVPFCQVLNFRNSET
jgi:hypothetical protein